MVARPFSAIDSVLSRPMHGGDQRTPSPEPPQFWSLPLAVVHTIVYSNQPLFQKRTQFLSEAEKKIHLWLQLLPGDSETMLGPGSLISCRPGAYGEMYPEQDVHPEQAFSLYQNSLANKP